MFRKGDEFIPGYRLEQFLGRGQFGEVWRTTAPGRTSAALKIIDLSGKQGSKEFRAIQRIKEIRHANLMPITALWLLDSEFRPMEDAILDTYKGEDSVRATLKAPSSSVKPSWLVVAMLLGQGNLSNCLENHQQQGQPGIPPEELVKYMEEAAKGIDFLNTRQHDLGDGRVSIQHCDIKPENMMLVGDSVLVCDFGLAHFLSDTQATATGMVGSPAYMAPECIAKRPSSATDQYSLAISYVELRTGRLPFVDESYFAVVDAHRTGKLDLSGLSTEEAAVIRRATAMNPADRFPTTSQMVAALKSTLEPDRATTAPSKVPVFAAVVFGVALLAGGGYVFFNRPQAQPNGLYKEAGREQIPVAESTRKRLKFIPKSATVVVGDQPLELDSNGEIELDLPSSGTIDIEVRDKSSSDYVSLNRRFTAKQLEEQAYTIELSYSGEFHIRRASEFIESGNQSAAVEELTKAVRLDYNLKPKFKIQHHKKNIGTAAVSSDSKLLAFGSDDLTVSIFNFPIDSAAPPVVLQGHSKVVDTVRISAGNKWIITASEDKLLLWPNDRGMQSGKVPTPKQLVGHEGDVAEVALSPDGRWLATGGADTTIRLWDLSSSDPAASSRELKGHTEQIQALAFSHDSSILASSCYDGELIQWTIEPSGPIKPQQLAKLNRESRAIQFLGSLKKWGVGLSDGGVAILSTSSKSSPIPLQTESISWLASDSTGKWLCAGADKTVAVLELKSQNVPLPLMLNRHTEPIVTGQFVPNSDVLITGSWDGTVLLSNLRSPDPNLAPLRLTADGAGRISCVLVSPDGNWLIVSDENGRTSIWDLRLCLAMLKALEESKVSTKPGIET